MKRGRVFVATTVLVPVLMLAGFMAASFVCSGNFSPNGSYVAAKPLTKVLAKERAEEQSSKAEVAQRVQGLKVPFIANNGQVDERVQFYARTFGGTVFVTKDGEIVYALPKTEKAEYRSLESASSGQQSAVSIQEYRGEWHLLHGIRDEAGMSDDYYASDIVHPASWIVDRKGNAEFQNPESRSSHAKNLKSAVPNPKSEMAGVALREEFVGARVHAIQGEDPSVTRVNYFTGNDPEKWKTDVSTYDFVNLGEIYQGIELRLKAYGDNVEKLFYVKPGASPEQIQIRLDGIQPPENPPPLSPSMRGTDGCPPLAGAGGGEAGGGLGARGLSVNEDVAPTFMVGSCSGGGLWVNDEGQLVAETELGPVTFTKPVAYQEIDGKRVEVECGYVILESEGIDPRNTRKDTKVSFLRPFTSFRGLPEVLNTQYVITHPLPLSGGEYKSPLPGRDLGVGNSELDNPSPIYGFKVAAYDRTKDLIIDPLLASTFLGGSKWDEGYALALDTSGNVYVTGVTLSTNFPKTSGAYDTTFNGGGDVFVSKLNSRLTRLLASTYLGGAGNDYGYSLSLDISGNVYVTGYTFSSNFPTTNGAYDTSFNGGRDVFVSKLNSGLTRLLASTYLGGSTSDYGQSLALDTGGHVYVTGYTDSTDFRTTNGAYDTSHNGGPDVFVSKLDTGLTRLLASTYLGGSNIGGADADYGTSLALDTSGNVYVTGYTFSTDFPTASGAYDTFSYGDGDAFVSKLDGGLTSLLASTYLGGSWGSDFGYSLTLDTSGNVYVTGNTSSEDFPTTSGAYDTSYSGRSDVFVSKLDGGLTSLLASTFLGGSNDDYGQSLARDTSGNVYVTGFTQSADFPTTSGAYDTSYDGYHGDVFISKLDSGLTNLRASTYLGGSDSDSGYALTLDTKGNVYVMGKTLSTDFPATGGAYDTSYNGSWDVFVSKLDGNLSYLSSPPVAADQAVTTDEDTSANITLTASDPDGGTLTFSVVSQPVHGTLSGNAQDVVYTPHANFNGTDSFTFKANDEHDDSNVATITITVNAVDDPLVAANQSVRTDEDTPVNITLIASDPDNNTLIFTSIVSQPVHGTLLGKAPDVVYTPHTNFNGTDSFTFKAHDSFQDSNVATVTITVTSVSDENIDPANNDSQYAYSENAGYLNFEPRGNGGPGAEVSNTNVIGYIWGENIGWINLSPTSYGGVVNDGAGNLSGYAWGENVGWINFKPTGGGVVIGTNGVFDGWAWGENIGWIHLKNPAIPYKVKTSWRPAQINHAPVAADQSVATNVNTPVNITLTASDLNEDALTFTVVSQPVHGTLSGNAPDVVYAPNANFNGADSFTFKANDGQQDSNMATVTITVNVVNGPPVAESQIVTTDEDTSVNITLTASDPDGDALTFTVVSQPGHGTFKSGNPPDMVYTPHENFHGKDHFKFKVSDGLHGSDVATVTIKVNAVDDPLVAASQSVTMDEDTVVNITLTASDPDNNTLIFTSVVSQPVHGTLSGNAPDVVYTPDTDFNGTDSFTFKAHDSFQESNVATVTITVTPVRDENIDPANNDSQYSYSENAGYLNFEPGGNGGSGAEVTNTNVIGYVWGENIGWINLSPASYGGVANDGAGNLSGYAWGENVGWINFKPAGGGVTIGTNGVFDGWAWGENIGWIQLKNTAIPYKVQTSWRPVQTNLPPVAADQAVTIDEYTIANITLTASDPDKDALTFTVVSQPVHGILSGNAPNVVYTPNTNFKNTDNFTFKANDGHQDSNVATVTINVKTVNDPPVASEDTAKTKVNTPVKIRVLKNDKDMDGDSLSVTAVTQGANGSVVIKRKKYVIYTPVANFLGKDNFTYTISDGRGGESTGKVKVNVR